VDNVKIEKLDELEIEKRGIKNWGVWEKEPSEFDWAYTREVHCLILCGSALIETEGGTIEIKEGDYVVFPTGLKCRWIVKDGLKKYYDFK
jgi:uncharacterized cupin superfamily protein